MTDATETETDFEKAEITRKTLDALYMLSGEHGKGLISGNAFTVAFYAIYDAVSGLADWDTLHPLLEQFEEEKADYVSPSHVAVLTRNGKTLVVAWQDDGVKVVAGHQDEKFLAATDRFAARERFDRVIDKLALDGWKVRNL